MIERVVLAMRRMGKGLIIVKVNRFCNDKKGGAHNKEREKVSTLKKG